MKYKEPVLICPGVIKSGTTFLYEILAKSPKLSVAKNKEVHFFHMHSKIVNICSKVEGLVSPNSKINNP